MVDNPSVKHTRLAGQHDSTALKSHTCTALHTIHLTLWTGRLQWLQHRVSAKPDSSPLLTAAVWLLLWHSRWHIHREGEVPRHCQPLHQDRSREPLQPLVQHYQTDNCSGGARGSC